MAPSSSASKVAKLAQKGKGKKVRFQGGTLFPLVIVAVLVILLPLVVYARQSRPGPGEGEPRTGQHWHASYGFYVCDEFGIKTESDLTGELHDTDPTTGLFVDNNYGRTGVHSHDDGVVHWHPFTTAATGTNAKLKIFLRNYGITLTNTKLSFPDEQGGETFEEGKTTCKVDGEEKDASLKVWVWDSYTDVEQPPSQTYTTNMSDIRIKNDGMVFMVAFVPDDTDPAYPESAPNLLDLGANDGGDSASTTTPETPATGSTETSVSTDASVTESPDTTSATTPSSGSGEPSESSTATTG